MGNTLAVGQKLVFNQQIASANGMAYLVMQSDGDLVLYRNDTGARLFASNTAGQPVTHAIMQSGGDLVCTDASSTVYWSTATHTASSTVKLNDDGTLVVIGPAGHTLFTSTNAPVTWPASFNPDRLLPNMELVPDQKITSQNSKAYLTLQSIDGNLVLYRKDSGTALWSSGTNGKSVPRAIMQPDGDFVCYNAAGAAVWSSGTDGNAGAYVVMNSDGTLIVYSAADIPLWSSFTFQSDFTPSTVAARALQSVISIAPAGWPYAAMPTAPGWTYKVRLNGADSADAPFGWARIPEGASAGLAMGTDTTIHVASMSKPICITAFVALVEDWQALSDGVQGNGPLAANVTISYAPSGQPFTKTQLIQVPRWLVPAFSGAGLAAQLINAGLLNLVPQALKDPLNQFAFDHAWATPMIALPPGYVGLMTLIAAGQPVPKYSDPFLPLIKTRLQQKAASLGVSYVIGDHVAGVTLDQIITHNSILRDGITNASLFTLIPSAQGTQPSDGSAATGDLWAYLLAYLRQIADGQPGYKNDDYTVLGGIVEHCAGMLYDDYVAARLHSDPRFNQLRRFVVTPAKSALYYGDFEVGWGATHPFPDAQAYSGGNPFPDYRGFGAAGGFYYTADQITDWLYALYSGQSVQRAALTGDTSAPLLSSTSLATLFGATAYFAAGQKNNVSGWTTYTHNGGTSVGGGSCNGVLGIAASPAGAVLTAFLCANGDLSADAAFNAALAAVIAIS